MWVVKEIRKGGRTLYEKHWKLSDRAKTVLWATACFIEVVFILVVAYFESV